MSEYIEVDQEIPRFRVNRKVMTDPAVFAVERERIFDHSWLYIGHETELAKPNDYVTRTVAGRPLILARDAKGKVRVWVNSCPHRGAMLCREPKGNARFMTCFYHGWSFNNSGEVVSIPDDAGYEVASSDRGWRLPRRSAPTAVSSSSASIRTSSISPPTWRAPRSTWTWCPTSPRSA